VFCESVKDEVYYIRAENAIVRNPGMKVTENYLFRVEEKPPYRPFIFGESMFSVHILIAAFTL
jgi:hypothetical protein